MTFWPDFQFETKYSNMGVIHSYSYDDYRFDRLEALWSFMKGDDSSLKVLAQLFEASGFLNTC